MGTLTSRSPEETHALGVKLGRLLEVGDIVGLAGELGAGKTALVRGIADGAGVSAADVSSPTFTIVQGYKGRVPLYHADFYRLSGPDELYATGFFDLLEEGGAAVIEWVDRVAIGVPMLRVEIAIVDATTRTLSVTASGERAGALLAAWLSA